MGRVLLGGRKRMYGTLPEQVSGFYAARGNAQVTLTWTNPGADWAGTRIVRKTGGYPQRASDGVTVCKGAGTNCTDTGLTNGTQYYYRAFAYNSRGEYQTISRTATATPISYQLASALPIGTSITINESGTPAEYFVVHRGNPDTSIYADNCNGVWILRKTLLAEMSMYKQGASTNHQNCYNESPIHSYLNGDYYNSLNAAQCTAVKQVNVPYVMGNAMGMEEYGSNGFQAKIFILSGCELGESDVNEGAYLKTDGAKLDYFKSGYVNVANELNQAYDSSGKVKGWWTRSPVRNNSSNEWTVLQDGSLSRYIPYTDSYFVRPACILSNNAKIASAADSSGRYALIGA